MAPLFSFRLCPKKPDVTKPATEPDVVRAANAFIHKGAFVDQLLFLPPEMKKAAKDAALNRFLEVLVRYMQT